jgi:predicted secreted Zn-dependent protease
MRATLLILMIFWGTVATQAAQQSKVINYPVMGSTAAAIYQSIKTTSPRIAANATFAFTLPYVKNVKREKKSVSACGYSSFKTSSIYHFVVPKLVASKGTPTALRKQFGGFSAYLLEHEKLHRENWIGCLASYDREAMKLSAKDCTALDRKREKLFTSIKKKCVAKDEAFDFYFRKEVLKHPFVKAALQKN